MEEEEDGIRDGETPDDSDMDGLLQLRFVPLYAVKLLRDSMRAGSNLDAMSTECDRRISVTNNVKEHTVAVRNGSWRVHKYKDMPALLFGSLVYDSGGGTGGAEYACAGMRSRAGTRRE